MNRIFLIGDSIRMGYCEHVKGLMADCAEVIYHKVNCRSSQCILMNLFDWSRLCDAEGVTVVHFNCGHWDAARFDCDPQPLTSLGEYEKNLESIVRNLKKYYEYRVTEKISFSLEVLRNTVEKSSRHSV